MTPERPAASVCPVCSRDVRMSGAIQHSPDCPNREEQQRAKSASESVDISVLPDLTAKSSNAASVRREEYGYGAWYPQGVTPTPGERYEFQDFVGARFVATVREFHSVFYPDEPVGERLLLRIEFDDRPPFETNLPILFRELAS